LNFLNCTLEVSLLIVFGIVSRRTRERNFYAAGVEEVSMRSFASPIDKPMLFQIGDELPNLTRHTESITEKRNFKALPRSLQNSRSSAEAIGAQRAIHYSIA
jgi:hypothetical protein